MAEWISVKDRLPESGEVVLLLVELRYISGDLKSRYVCDGYYAKRYTEIAGNHNDDIACEYNEENDEYYLEEGWYEVIKNWGEYDSVVIEYPVTHWMPLPEPPKGE